MLSVKDIKYEVVQQDDFIKKLLEYPDGDVAFDYETYNDVDGDMAVEPWSENTHPFCFSVCSLTDPENTIKVFNFRELTQEQKAAFKKFLTSRHVWAFNCKFEGAVTWRLLGKPIKFDDVQCLYKTKGEFINELSLKKGTAKLFDVTEWADDTWETLKVIREIVSRVQEVYVTKGKTDEWVEAFLEGNVKRIYDLVHIRNYSTDKITKKDAEFMVALRHARPHLTPSVILNALTKSGMNADKVNLKYVPKNVVERYCAYDALATAYNYQKLYEECKEQYHIYLKQSWLAMLMEAYGMTRDLTREKEIETHYQDQILHYMKEILSIPEFTDTLKIAYIENRINPESGRLKNFKEYRTGFELEDHAYVKNATDYENLKEKYWNYNSPQKETLELFYNALFSSDMAMSSVVAYHLKKYLVQLEGFSDIIDGQEISKAKRIKWNNIAELYTDAVNHISEQFQSAKSDEEYHKWAEISSTLEKTYQEAVLLKIAPTQGERAKFADIEDIRLSLKKENVEILFSALNECADLSPDAPWDTLPWEMKMVFCCKVVKKLDKALTAWVRGKVGRDRVRKCQFGESLLDVPKRTEQGDNPLFQTSFNDCSAETKRWKSPIHAIPRGSELSEMIVPRYEDSILVHFDYSQMEVRVVAALANETNLITLFKDNPKADIHRLMASNIWNKPPEKISSEERRASKGCVFSLIYGATVESIANLYFDSNITKAKDVVNKFYKAYPNILKWCNERHIQVDKYGYVSTLFGDRIYIESKSKGELHRRSQNYPVQSSSSNIAGYAIYNLYEQCQSEGIEAVPQCFIHDSSDWDVRLRDLVRFIKAVNKCAVDDVSTEFGIPMKIDFEMGINLNFTMHIENPEFTENGVKFNFKCPEIFYKKLLKRLSIIYTLGGEITDSSPETESWANIFVTKRPYSMYLNKPINVFEGNLTLKYK